MFVLDQRTANPDVDFTYDYVKQLFVPERSQSVNVSAFACRLRMTDGNQQMQTTAGVYATDVLTLNGHASDGTARFCDLNTPRTAAKQKDDELKWLMQLPSDVLVIPKPIYNSILKAFGGRSYGRCSNYANPPPVQLMLQGAAYSVELGDYFRPSANNPDFCNLLIDQTAPNAEVDVVLGRSFLSRFCLLLDYANAQLGLSARRYPLSSVIINTNN
ncbi:hypothetical protein M3Y99_01856100 [Aphelenchoides fujianensis]|nr:hypothetical protein M3Y99_01856100 [Aphelenchoides fujianensis]